jgi:hypothetical protein
MTAPRSLLALASLAALASFLAASSTAASPPRKSNDGLPRKWFGVTALKVENGGLTTAVVATVTFTLVGSYGSAGRGTYYEYRPSGSFVVDHHGTDAAGCIHSTPPNTSYPLVRGQGILAITVSRRPGKPVKAEYQVGGGYTPTYFLKNPTLTSYVQIVKCPDVGYTGSEQIEWIHSGPLRGMRPTAKIVQGTFQGEVRKDEWCLVRSRPDVLKCDLGIGSDS